MENISVPMGLDAFTLTPKSCSPDSNIVIAPLTQPSYVGLRLDGSIIQHDVLNHVDLHNTTDPASNPRITDIGSPDATLKQKRLGVYLHWSLPRMYRTATAAADTAKGYPGSNDATAPNPNPIFRPVPNRWLVVRNLKSSDPVIPAGLTSWVIESDRLRFLSDIDKTNPDLDLENDVAPFLSYDPKSTDPDPLRSQAEVFIGNKVQMPYKEAPDGQYIRPLTIMNSSNPLFPDYTPHNANVFSTVDNFEYLDSSGKVNYLRAATADYFVLGWHTDGTQDPFARTDVSFSKRLSDLLLQQDPVDTATAAQIDSTNNSKLASRLLCHSAVYNVSYSIAARTKSIADEIAASFAIADDGSSPNTGNSKSMEPVSIGTTPLDGIVSFLDAHNHKGEEEHFFGTGGDKLAGQVLALKELLYASDDTYDERVKAQDLVFEHNYSPSDGGTTWNYANTTGPGEVPVPPSPAVQTTLDGMNENQLRLDTAQRKYKLLKWDLFAEWWKFVSDQNNQTDAARESFRPRVKEIRDQLDILQAVITKLDGAGGDIATAAGTILAKKTTKPPFFTRKDPTLCIAGMDSGWPADFMDAAIVRLDHQVRESVKDLNPQATESLFPKSGSPVPIDNGLRDSAQLLLSEFLGHPIADGALTEPKSATALPTSPSTVPQSGLTLARPGTKTWNGLNPFVPLFIEYELLYYHIDFAKWQVIERQSPFNHATSHLRYGSLDGNSPLYLDTSNQEDVRSLTGRVIILPQPVFDLAATVGQVTNNLPKGFSFPADSNDVPKPTLQEQVNNLMDNIGKLKFISAPLTGVTNHLLTRAGGSHVKPGIRIQGRDVSVLDRAVMASNLDTKNKPIQPNENLDAKALEIIGAESTLTPYGNLVDFTNQTHLTTPFKGVTHGQMVFRKLNIIDKFGQAIALPSTKPRLRHDTQDTQSIYPCLSDFLSPSTLPPDPKTGLPYGNLNTVFKEPDIVESVNPLCRFMQLTPSINQDTRLNAAFVSKKVNQAGKLAWAETSEYDIPSGPVWGWVVINYADSGLQFFLGDGTFYREVRMGGMNSTTTSDKWLPFPAPTKTGTDASLSGPPNAQLDALISKLQAGYLQSFCSMINASISTMPFPPSSYSAFANSIVGKPLALTNVGWSIELSSPAFISQNTLGPTSGNEVDSGIYSFPLKVGDKDRPFDGVVGFWEQRLDTDGSHDSTETNFDTCYTYFAPIDKTGKAPFQAIAPENFRKLQPTYVNPEFDKTDNMTEAVARNYYVTTCLIDPYTPLHGFSPILPIKTLNLPLWCVQEGFKRITAFFHLGPQLATKDIPPYSTTAAVTSESWSTPPPVDTRPAPILLPISGRKGLWKWLQPYRLPGTDDGGGDGKQTLFNSLDVGEDDGKIRSEPAPYTFVEGYLQLAAPLIDGDKLKS